MNEVLRNILNSLEIATPFISVISGILIIYYFYSSKKKERVEIEIEEMRKLYEDKIYRLTGRLLSTGERWEDINHLILSAERRTNSNIFKNPTKIYLSNFLTNFGITETDLIIEKDVTFVLSPFNPTFKKTYKVIYDTCFELGFKSYRGDENYIKGDIFPSIIKRIVQSRFIIAILDGRNPNVYYELGIAQALDKPIILISSGLENATFDIQSQQLILYRNYEDLKAKLNRTIIKLMIEEDRMK